MIMIIYSLVTKAITLIAGSGSSVIEPSALVALMAEPLVLVIYLKYFSFHTKNLEIFY